MAILPIITAPDPRLKVVSKPVATVTDETRALLDNMLETMHDAIGIGLAAIQVGINARVIVVELPDEDGEQKGDPLELINPKIVWSSEDERAHEEGCLSLPEHFAEVIRPDGIKLEYLDRNGKKQTMAADGLLATCIQHEMDHLEGILFVDHISAVRRNMILRKLKKLRRMNPTEAA